MEMRLRAGAETADVPAYVQVPVRRDNHSGETDVTINRERDPISDTEREIDALYDAIVEGRRDDAIDMIRVLFGMPEFRSVAEQRNLFPDRVPA